jgi:hypothetical protein
MLEPYAQPSNNNGGPRRSAFVTQYEPGILQLAKITHVGIYDNL